MNSNRAKFCAFLVERSLQQEFEVWAGSWWEVNLETENVLMRELWGFQ